MMKSGEEKMTETKYFKYSVAPFSGKNFFKNEAKEVAGCMPCGICGKPTKESVPHWGIVINGGAAWGSLESEQNGGHMGSFPIGRDCHKKYVEK